MDSSKARQGGARQAALGAGVGRAPARRWFATHARMLCVMVIIAAAVEVFGFNHYVWSTMGQRTIEQPYATVLNEGDLEYGREYSADDMLTITVYPSKEKGAYGEIDSIDLGVTQITADGSSAASPVDLAAQDQCHLTEWIGVTDQGSQDGYTLDSNVSRSIPSHKVRDDGEGRMVCPAVPSRMYRSLNAQGLVRQITVTFRDTVSGTTALRIDSITLNEHVPLRFNAVRFLLLALVPFGLLCLFERSDARMAAFLCGIVPIDDSRGGASPACGAAVRVDQAGLGRRWRLVWLAVMAATAVCAVGAQAQSFSLQSLPRYSQLAHAFAQGRLAIDSSSVAQASDGVGAASAGYASYGGNTYVIAGVVPAVAIYLPYFLLVGSDPSDRVVMCILDVLVVAGAFLLVDELRRRLCPSMPRGLLMLLSVVAAVAPCIMFVVKSDALGFVASTSGVAFVTWGLWLWLRSVRGVDSRGRGLSVWRAALGSLCMALAVGCRPTMALYSLLAFPVFWRVVVRPRSNWWRVLLAVLPYVPVAAGLMWYNAARFGSPFEFGARYQLTAIDALHQGVHLSRVPLGLWYYLANPPTFMPEFPYLREQNVITHYNGPLDAQLTVGGLLFLIPLLAVLVVPRAVRRCRDSRALCVTGVVLGVLCVCADVLCTGLSVFGQSNAAMFFLLAALCVAMEWMQDAAARDDAAAAERRYRILCVLAVLSIVLAVLMAMCQYEVVDASSAYGNRLYYMRMWDFFDLLKL